MCPLAMQFGFQKDWTKVIGWQWERPMQGSQLLQQSSKWTGESVVVRRIDSCGGSIDWVVSSADEMPLLSPGHIAQSWLCFGKMGWSGEEICIITWATVVWHVAVWTNSQWCKLFIYTVHSNSRNTGIFKVYAYWYVCETGLKRECVCMGMN
jgi:hypothetical protein